MKEKTKSRKSRKFPDKSSQMAWQFKETLLLWERSCKKYRPLPSWGVGGSLAPEVVQDLIP